MTSGVHCEYYNAITLHHHTTTNLLLITAIFISIVFSQLCMALHILKTENISLIIFLTFNYIDKFLFL